MKINKINEAVDVAPVEVDVQAVADPIFVGAMKERVRDKEACEEAIEENKDNAEKTIPPAAKIEEPKITLDESLFEEDWRELRNKYAGQIARFTGENLGSMEDWGLDPDYEADQDYFDYVKEHIGDKCVVTEYDTGSMEEPFEDNYWTVKFIDGFVLRGVSGACLQLIGKNIHESLITEETVEDYVDIQEEVEDYVTNVVSDFIANDLSCQVIAQKVSGYNPDWCAEEPLYSVETVYNKVLGPVVYYVMENLFAESEYPYNESLKVEAFDDDEIAQSEQKYDSAKTSINSSKLPAIFNLVKFQPNTINLDYGGGKFDNAAEYLATKDVTNLVYDPYNRSAGHNSDVLKQIRSNGGADTATLSNVLNVIAEPEVRKEVLENIKKLLKSGGTLYVTVYEGSGSGVGAETKSGYQLNKKTADYLDEIKEVFPGASRKGKLIVCKN